MRGGLARRAGVGGVREGAGERGHRHRVVVRRRRAATASSHRRGASPRACAARPAAPWTSRAAASPLAAPCAAAACHQLPAAAAAPPPRVRQLSSKTTGTSRAAAKSRSPPSIQVHAQLREQPQPFARLRLVPTGLFSFSPLALELVSTVRIISQRLLVPVVGVVLGLLIPAHNTRQHALLKRQHARNTRQHAQHGQHAKMHANTFDLIMNYTPNMPEAGAHRAHIRNIRRLLGYVRDALGPCFQRVPAVLG